MTKPPDAITVFIVAISDI